MQEDSYMGGGGLFNKTIDVGSDFSNNKNEKVIEDSD